MHEFALVIPTLNAEAEFRRLLPSLAMQTRKPTKFLVMDSQSTDDTVAMAREAGAEVVEVKRSEFNHGGTRFLGAQMVREYPVVVFMTQDAVLASDDSLELLLAHFEREEVDAAYGRQLPRDGASHIEAFARLFNYPAESDERSIADSGRLGFKLIFFSNSFSAYRTRRLFDIGGFRSDVIFGEDSIAIAKLLATGGRIIYDGKAAVKHSHSYTIAEEFRRYFDIGVMHASNHDLFDIVGPPTSSGRAFVMAELGYLATRAPWRIPEAIVRTLSKYLGYKLGSLERKLSLETKKRLSMNRRYWASYGT